MSNKLFVAGLSYDLTTDQLTQHFAQYGTVTSAQIITDRMSGRSKGFGFVEMSSEEEAQAAIKALNDTEFAGRTIVVNEARPQEPRNTNFSGGRGGFSGNRTPFNRNQRNSRDSKKRSNRW